MSSQSRTATQALVLASALTGFTAAPLQAQNVTSTIRGTVTDQSEGALPGATVSAVNDATNLQRTVVTDGTGRYAIPLLPTGRYTLTVSLQGFKREVVKDVALQMDQSVTIDATLELGSIDEEVTVTANPVLINTSDASIGDVIENKRIIDLPLNGRNFQQLSLLTAGTTVGQEGGTQDFFGTASGSLGFVVNGGRDDQNHFSIDGINAMDHYFNTLTLSPSVDAIQEFKVQQNSYSAEAGMFGSGQVNVSIKSGANEFHGSVYEFFRNEGLDAKNFFDVKDRPTPDFSQNNFGMSLGGPLKTDKTFFFVAYEGLRIDQSQTVRSALPTALERQGTFAGRLNDPDPSSPFPFVFDPVTNTTTIPQQRFGPVARNIVDNFFPVPTFPDQPGLNNISVATRIEDRDQFVVRIDHEVNPSNRLFARYIWARSEQSFPFGDNILTFDPPPPPGFPTPVDDDSQNLAIGLTSALSSNFVNELRLGWNFYDGKRGAGNQINFARDVLGQDIDIAPRDQGYPAFHLAGISQFGDSDVFNPLFRKNSIFQFNDNVVWTKGKHQIKFGADVRLVYFDTLSNFFTRGFPNFDTVSLTGNFLADFLLDRPFAIVRLKGDTEGRFRTNLWAGYLSDTWQVSPRLSVNFGVRYEVFPPIYERDNRLAVYDVSTQSIIIAGDTLPPEVTDPDGFAQQYDRLLAAFGLPPVDYVTAESRGLGRSVTKTDWGNVAPRFGFSYQLNEEGRTVLRGGWGIYNALRDYSASSDSRNMLPFAAQIVLVDLARLGVPIPPVTYADQYNTIGNLPVVGGIGPQVDMPIGWFDQITAGIQHEIARGVAVDVSYIRTRGHDLNRLTTSNQERLSGPTAGLRDDPRFGFLIQEASGATSSYDGAVIRLEKQFGGGVGFVTSYTFSHSIDTVSSARENGGAPTREQDSFDLPNERGGSNFDVRHRFIGSFTWELPFGGEGGGFLNGLVSGWQLAGIATFQSGQPFTPQYPGGSGPGDRFPRPSQDGNGNLTSGQRDPSQWFDPNVYFAPDFIPGTTTAFPGDSGRNSLIGDGIQTLDLTLQKLTRIGGAQLQLRLEVFNLLNHPNFNLPDRVFVPGPGGRNINPNFGVVTSARSPRVVQLGAKIVF